LELFLECCIFFCIFFSSFYSLKVYIPIVLYCAVGLNCYFTTSLGLFDIQFHS
jgi:hypothetical protein